jgi:hypothetical protein
MGAMTSRTQCCAIVSRRPKHPGIVGRVSQPDSPLVFPRFCVKPQSQVRVIVLTFSMKLNIYFIVLWKVSSSTACGPTDKWLITRATKAELALFISSAKTWTDHLEYCYKWRYPLSKALRRTIWLGPKPSCLHLPNILPFLLIVP